jgi:hypothetical protein
MGIRPHLASRWPARAALTAVVLGCTFGIAADGAQAATAVFASTGLEQTFMVPAGVTSLHVVAVGGHGGKGGPNAGGGAGGGGAVAAGDVSVTPGEPLYVEVAGNGSDENLAAQTPTQGVGGFNGGADGGGSSDAGQNGGGGGGASDVRTLPASAGASSLASRLIIAAGGAGGGGGGVYGGAGGAAGAGGSNGGFGGGGSPGTAGYGGTPGMTYGGTGQSGVAGAGGAGASGGQTTCGAGGGGGGGGLYGGGGGGAGGQPTCSGPLGGGGGGGGSSGLAVSVTNGSVAATTTTVPYVAFTYYAKPQNTNKPKIAGQPLPGKTLTCTNGTWSGDPSAFSYQWRRDGAAISNATASQYRVKSGDSGHRLTCTVTAANPAGSASATSDSVKVPQCVVPRVLGKSLGNAKRLIKKAHCAVGKVTRKTSSRKAGIVLKQSPRAGTRRRFGAKVALVVSKH